MPDVPGGGERQRRAAQLRAEEDARRRAAEAQAAGEDAQSPTAQSAGPVGQGEYVVKDGDCITSIAKNAGHFWETVWQDAQNSGLREARKDPNVLLPGDRVHIPDVRKKYESGDTEMRHRFVRRGEPAALRLRLLEDDVPRGNVPWTLEVEGRTYSGVTDASGQIDVSIPGDARIGRLTLTEEGEEPEVISLNLGHLDPVEALSGVQERLRQLDYEPGAIDGELGPRTRAALEAFQKDQGLPETGEPDPQTRERLRTAHES